MVKFDVIHMKSRDVKAAAKWYEDMLGAQIIDCLENESGLTVRTKLEGTAINITQHPDAASLPGVPLDRFVGIEHVGFAVDNLDEKLAELKSRGVEIISPVGGSDKLQSRWFFVRAPDGVRIEFVEYGR